MGKHDGEGVALQRDVLGTEFLEVETRFDGSLSDKNDAVFGDEFQVHILFCELVQITLGAFVFFGKVHHHLVNDIVVCNCWQYDNDGQSVYDNTLSVVDIASFTESRKIQVGTNPGKIKALDSHRCIVACSGDYGANPAQTIVLDLSNDSQETLPINATNFDVCNGYTYLYATAYDENWNTTTSFYKMDINTLSCSPILESHSNTLSNAYGINIDPSTGNIYICNSAYGMNGDLYCFAPDGKELWHAEACFYASKVVF